LNYKNQSNQLNCLQTLWLKAEILSFLSSVYGNHFKDKISEEAYAILALDNVIDSFNCSYDMNSVLLDLITGQKADAILTKMQSMNSSTSRLVRQGRIAELSARAILAFPPEKARPLIDFSRTDPIRSIRKDEVTVKVKVTPESFTSVTYYSRPWSKLPDITSNK
jgi:hypothetical protein